MLLLFLPFISANLSIMLDRSTRRSLQGKKLGRKSDESQDRKDLFSSSPNADCRRSRTRFIRNAEPMHAWTFSTDLLRGSQPDRNALTLRGVTVPFATT